MSFIFTDAFYITFSKQWDNVVYAAEKLICEVSFSDKFVKLNKKIKKVLYLIQKKVIFVMPV